METIDPATGRPLPPDAIVRILHVTPKVHIYTLPRDAVSTAAGYAAASWTSDPRNHIFTARLRVLETSIPVPTSSSESTTTTAAFTITTPTQQDPPAEEKPEQEEEERTELKIDILLEDPTTGTLFAAAPYTAPATVEPTTDSSRFFAVRVQDPTGKQKATLGIGFEERSEAFDFGVALQEARRALSWESAAAAAVGPRCDGDGARNNQGRKKGGCCGEDGEEEEKRDLSLKEGETITVNLSGTRFGRRAGRAAATVSRPETERGGGGGAGGGQGQSLASFALPPPPPPPSSSSRAQKRLSAQQLGFDDGKFGEFA
ncbi:adaptin ear-binding coat-associated protein 1 NECAP-1 [Parathielavia appendiculata]|uniref:Adaptin ear-binding coat-associated protein 1 NECAP-1 n=1 Tax=Parathielavia appendiculata TaxID=2587402 RepID=A0AAN6TVX0_9PEZI|nr:adaptin ear-binding coat-associated protein 1 NECAP-1 [Parathielavia appendiculata]